jgi:hypothetical protein
VRYFFLFFVFATEFASANQKPVLDDQIRAIMARAELGHYGRWVPLSEKVLNKILSDGELQNLQPYARLKYARLWSLRQTEVDTMLSLIESSNSIRDDLQKYWSMHSVGQEPARSLFVKRAVEQDIQQLFSYREPLNSVAETPRHNFLQN